MSDPVFGDWIGGGFVECDPEELAERLDMILTRVRRNEFSDAETLIIRLLQEVKNA